MLTERKGTGAGEGAATTWRLSQARQKVPVPVANGAAVARGRTALPPGGRRRALRPVTRRRWPRPCTHAHRVSTKKPLVFVIPPVPGIRGGEGWRSLCCLAVFLDKRKDYKRGLCGHTPTHSWASSPTFSP